MYLYGQTAFQLLQISIFGVSPPDQLSWFSAFQLFCPLLFGFSAFLLFCFSAFLFFSFSASQLFSFSAFWIFSFSAFRLFSFLDFQLFCFSAFHLFGFSAFRPFRFSAFLFSAFQLLSHQTALARSPSVSQPSQLLKSATYLLSGPLFTLLRKLNGGRKNEER